MLVNGSHYRSVWIEPDKTNVVKIIDQRKLPHFFEIEELKSVDDIAIAIQEMHIRGAPAIGATAAWGVYFAVIEASKTNNFDESLAFLVKKLVSTRPTAINLKWAVERMIDGIKTYQSISEKIHSAYELAHKIAEEDVECCKKIGLYGVTLLEKLSNEKHGKPVNIMTHCNAGWIACVDYGTVTSPIYEAQKRGIPVHVWVSETRPRNQGSQLTAWELSEQGVPHTIFVDNAAGILMQRGLVDLVIVGSDRTTINGDVCNKIGTYLKAVAAKENSIPFYVALPSSTIDWNIADGLSQIPIEERDPNEVLTIQGLYEEQLLKVAVANKTSPVSNFGFDVTPSKFVTGLITERGICKASYEDIKKLFPEHSTHNE